MSNKEKIPNYLNPPSPDPLEMNEDNLWVVFFKTSRGSQILGSAPIEHSFSLADAGDDGFYTHKKIDGDNLISAFSLSQLRKIYQNINDIPPIKNNKSIMPSWLGGDKKYVVWLEKDNRFYGVLVCAKDDAEALIFANLKIKDANPLFAGDLKDLENILKEAEDILKNKKYREIFFDRRKSQIDIDTTFQWITAKICPETYVELMEMEKELGEFDIYDGYEKTNSNNTISHPKPN